MAEREKQLTFMMKNGEVDWRKRVEAASEALAQAKSDSRWGRKEQALKKALEAAKLMPPPSKDFDSQRTAKRRNGGASKSSSQDESGSGDPTRSGDASSSKGSAGHGSTSESADGGSTGGGSAKAGKDAGDMNARSAGGGAGEGPNVRTSGESGGGASGNVIPGQDGELTSREGNGAGSSATGDQEEGGDGGPRVTNAEVQELRESLEALLKALDGKAGKSKSSLSFERDAIEIR